MNCGSNDVIETSIAITTSRRIILKWIFKKWDGWHGLD
jgi:hypothetical protein